MLKQTLFGLAALSISANAGLVTQFGQSWDSGSPVKLVDILAAQGLTVGVDIVQVDKQLWHGEGTSSLLIKEIAGQAPTNTFGWYEAGNTANNGVIFTGSATAPASAGVGFNGAQDVGFYLKSVSAPANPTENWFYSEESRNIGGVKQLAVYQSTTDDKVFYLGWEDLQCLDGSQTINGITVPCSNYSPNANNGKVDYDFNDMVLRVEMVPEPGTLGLLGLGLMGLFMAIRRRK